MFKELFTEASPITPNGIKVKYGKEMKDSIKIIAKGLGIDPAKIIVRGDNTPALFFIDAVLAYQSDESWKKSKSLKKFVETQKNEHRQKYTTHKNIIKIKSFTDISFKGGSIKTVDSLSKFQVKFIDTNNKEHFFYDIDSSQKIIVWGEFKSGFFNSNMPAIKQFISKIINGEYTSPAKEKPSNSDIADKKNYKIDIETPFSEMGSSEKIKEVILKGLNNVKQIEVKEWIQKIFIDHEIIGKSSTMDYGSIYGFYSEVVVHDNQARLRISNYDESRTTVTTVDKIMKNTEEILKLIANAKRETAASKKRYKR